MSFPDHMAYRPYHACTLSRYSPCKLSTAVSSSINHSYHNLDNLMSTAALLSCIRQILLSTAVVGTIFHSSIDAGFSKTQWKSLSVITSIIEVIKTLQRIKMESGSHARQIHWKGPPFYRSCVYKLEGTQTAPTKLPYPSKAH